MTMSASSSQSRLWALSATPPLERSGPRSAGPRRPRVAAGPVAAVRAQHLAGHGQVEQRGAVHGDHGDLCHRASPLLGDAESRRAEAPRPWPAGHCRSIRPQPLPWPEFRRWLAPGHCSRRRAVGTLGPTDPLAERPRTMPTSRSLGALAAVVTTLSWGGMFVVAESAFDHVDPVWQTAIRYGGASASSSSCSRPPRAEPPSPAAPACCGSPSSGPSASRASTCSRSWGSRTPRRRRPR